MQETIENNKNKYKIAIISPAPFYYHVPLYRSLTDSPDIDLKVYYCSDEVLRGKDIEKTYLVKGRISDDNVLKGYNYKFIKNYSLFPSYLSWPFGLINFGVWNEIKNGRYDAVLLQAWTNITWWIAFFACLRFNVPVLFMTDANKLSEASISMLKKVVKKIALNFLFKRTSGFLTTGEANEEFYRSYGVSAEKMSRFYFSWGYEEFYKNAKQVKFNRNIIRQSFGIKENELVLLYVGRLSREKNPDILLAAFDSLPATNKKLFFVGDGPLRIKMEKQIKEKRLPGIFFVGFQNRDKIGNYYAAADVLILPSISETWGIVVNEAMCFGLPIIASDKIGAAVDLVKDKYNGFIFSASNVKELAGAISNFVNLSPVERLSFGRRSNKMIEEWINKIDPVKQLIKLLSPLPQSKANDLTTSTNKKILMISPHVPWPLYGGPAVRMFNLLKELHKKGYQITLLAGSKDKKINSDNPLNKICENFYLYELPNQGYLSFCVRSFFSSKPYPSLRFQSDSLKEKLEDILRAKKFDMIWINFSILADILPEKMVKGILMVLDQHECEEVVYKDYIRNGRLIERLPALINLIKLERFHKKILSKFDAILCASKEEADFTRSQTNGKVKILVVPNGVDEEFFVPELNSINKSNKIVLCSNMSVRRNVDAVLWFARKIFPKIKSKISDAQFYVVGSSPGPEIMKLKSIPGVHVTGEVKDIREYYKMGKVFVASYRIGAGAKLKIFEAMASGIPIVCTSIACRGIDVVNKKHMLIVDTENEFADSVVSLLRNPKLAKKLAEESLALIKKEYYWSSIVGKLEPVLTNLKDNRN